MRHVSVFRLKPEYRTEEIVFRIAEQLRALPEQVPTILESEIGVKPIQIPPESPDGLVQDLIEAGFKFKFIARTELILNNL